MKSVPILTSVTLFLDKPSASDKRADQERLLDGLRNAGIDVPVEIDLELLRKLPALIREQDFSITLLLAFAGDRFKVVDTGKRVALAIAVDIGTTNIVASLFDLANKVRIGSDEHENPQAGAAGPDVLSRVYMAMSGKGGYLHSVLVGGINELIGRLCMTHGITAEDIGAVVFAGNTIMTHFLLDLPVDSIAVGHYIPVVHNPGFISPETIGVRMHSRGVVYVFPNAGSYVGGDIISGILCSRGYKQREQFIIIDAGTNAEIVLGCDEWIMVGAGAAGPALEDGIAEIGMRAGEGAINHVRIGMDDSLTLQTIGGKEPSGICGSGMIELVSEMYEAGIIDQQGKFGRSSKRIRNGKAGNEFVIYDSKDRVLAIKETDIENFLRSKAAMFASLYVMVKAVGLRFSDIARFYVSGALGSGIDADKAISIGFIPYIERSKFVELGNSSLAGAEMLLMNSALLNDIEAIRSMITYREMNTDGEFMKEFPAAMFIPHTNPEVLKG
jgi:uncharacterized 2Fe-2S/4Fe-4S cluster protein (DUF4445 family)